MAYKIKVSGDGVDMDKEVDEESALSILGILMGVKPSAVASSGKSSAQSRSHAAAGNAPELTIGEFLEESRAKSNPERIAAIAMYLRDYQDQESVSQSELGALFQRAGEVPPKNTSRDVNTAVKKRLIAEDAGNPGCYRITKTGEKSISRTET